MAKQDQSRSGWRGLARALRPLRVRPDLDASPAELAGRWARDPRDAGGLVFLDSSSSEIPVGEGAMTPCGGGISIIAPRPVRIHTGHLSRRGDLEAILAAHGEGPSRDGGTVDLGFPTGGLFGMVDYDGSYRFGEFHDLLVFDHASHTWYEVGRVDVPDRVRCEASAPGAGGFTAGAGALQIAPELDAAAFVALVRRAQAYIAAGDIYQVNLARRYAGCWPRGADAYGLYECLRDISPAPHGAYLDLAGRRVLSASPELFLRLSGRMVTTRPIKGTRPRFADPETDEKSAYDLITSAKEVAELVMITDLERNDLGQVCAYGSVRVSDLLKVERFAQVFHLVSTVCGELRPEVGPVEVLRRCFPGGSITGAPKKRAMEIIRELEPCPRGPYTGAIGYFGFNGESQFSIIIRTAVIEAGAIRFHSGAGIVADSVPEREFDETEHKAAGILRAVENWRGSRCRG